jgi:serine/threonine-protein kinase
MSPRTPFEFDAGRFVTPLTPSAGTSLAIIITLGFLTLSYLGVAYFMRRNIVLARSDRRGAARLAKVMGGVTFVASLLIASAAIDHRVFGSLHGAAAVALFAAAFCWAFYMAIEPFVRRQWPRVLIGWSRLMAGEWRDPQVGREIFLGSLAAVATAVMYVAAAGISLRGGSEPPMSEEFYFRALSGVSDLAAGLLQSLPWSIIVSLMWIVLLIILRRVLRSDLAAVAVLALLSTALVPTDQWIFVLALAAGNVLALMMSLRVGFLSLVSVIVVGKILRSLPISPDTPGFVGGLAWIPLLAIAVPTMFGLYTALAGQSIFGEARAE